MIRTAILHFDDKPDITQLLAANPGLAETIRSLTDLQTGQADRTVDVTDHALSAADHDEETGISQEETGFLKQFEDTDIFLPSDLKSQEMALGTLNINFVRWLKDIAEKTASQMRLVYTLEAGDYVYTDLSWEFSYRPDDQTVECYRCSNNDPSDEGQYQEFNRAKDDGTSSS